MARSRRLKLRRSDSCVVCETHLEAGTTAFWNADVKNVTCIGCFDASPAPTNRASSESAPPTSAPLDRGAAGASARRRYEGLHELREKQARDRFGRFSGIYLALTHEPQSTVAWAQGSRGERLLGEYLEGLHDERSLIVLHDRRIPGTRANIDHIAITRNGSVWAVDAKNYSGKVQRVDRGGWFSTDLRLYVGRRDCTKLVYSMAKQVDAMRTTLGQPLIEEFGVEVRAGLCFVNAEWSLFAKPFALESVWIVWPKALGKSLLADGELEPQHVMTLAQRVAGALPPAS
jgi:Nuclease-related domain